MNASDWFHRITSNSRRMHKEACVAAFAIELVTKRRTRALCCWCLERAELSPPYPVHEVSRLSAHAGPCDICDVTGRDVLVAMEKPQ
jgi:hypothetical protein